MKVVTSGQTYLDIDAYAGCIAYAELLRLQGHEAVAASAAPLNESISATVRSWRAPIVTDYVPSDQDTFILVDISNPEWIDKVANLERIDEVIDHHPGFEDFWHKRLGDRAKIEFIGAACTLVYEQWQLAGLDEQMSELSARLLLCGILDNTLNFGAKVTTKRDLDAYEALKVKSNLPDFWTGQYFTECQDAILLDPIKAIGNDTKVVEFRTYDQPVCVGQLAVWDAPQVIGKHQQKFHDVLSGMNSQWFMNLISVGERKSYFLTDNKEVQAWSSKLLGVQYEDTVAIANRLWLRKEIIKADIESAH